MMGVALALLFFAVSPASAIPFTLSYQGQVVVDGVRFEGFGQFKFALINGAGDSLWSHDSTSTAGSAPASHLTLPVNRGVYQVRIGDTAVPNMDAIPPAIFTNNVIRLRVWFNDGQNGFQQLTPDSEVASVAFAMRAGVADTVAPGAIDLAQFSASLMSAFTNLQADMVTLSNQVSAASLGSAVTVSTDPTDTNLLAVGYELFLTTDPAPWTAGDTAGSPSARDGHAAVWTGEQFMIWGGQTALGATDSGSMYDPDENNWLPILSIDQPAARSQHSVHWTGSSMLVWGGLNNVGYLNDGGRYDPVAQRWTAMTTTGAPEGRANHVSAWTGTELVVWGGQSPAGALSDGGIYNPTTDTWTALSLPNAPSGRFAAEAVWAGDRLLVWGGEAALPLDDGAQLVYENGVATRWDAISATGAPSARSGHSIVWTGTEMIVWGGDSNDTKLGDGSRYNPTTDTWTPLSTDGAPGARDSHSAVWTGVDMLIIGGRTANGATATGFAYDPATDKWRPLSNLGVQQPRFDAAAAWTGSKYVTFGGNNGSAKLANLLLLEPQPIYHLFRKR